MPRTIRNRQIQHGARRIPMKTNAIRLSDHFTYSRLFRFTLPSVMMMVFTSIYGVVDGLFVSNFAGKTAFAAINLIMPYLMVMGSIGFMIGTGGSALVSMTMGQDKEERANQLFSMMILFTVITGVLTSVLGNLAMERMALFLGATEEMMHDCLIYGWIVNGFNFAFMLQNLFQSFFVTAEKPRLGLYVTVAAGLTNMILDAFFVGVLRMGVAGAAWATGFSQVVGGVLPLLYFARKNTSRLHIVPVRLERSPILKACGNGSSELMSNISSSLVSMLYNFELMKMLGEDGVSAYGVLMYVSFIFVAIDIGYSVGSAPIIGYHYGAGNTDELKNMLQKSSVIMGVMGILMTAAALVLAEPVSSIFVGYDAGLFALTMHAFRIFSLSFLLSGFNIFASSFFTALNNGKVSAAISFLRTLVFQSACVLLLPKLLGADGIWWAVTAANLVAFIISALFLVAKRETYHYY